jgi:AcrR family transcriptional regulator
MTDRTEPRESILQAATQRILHYGYNKTTMNEIASDCSMSAGNIYRFFPSKIHIAEAMVRAFSAETHQTYAAIVGDETRPPDQKLKDFFRFRLERTFRLFERHPKLMELADFITREKPDTLAEERGQERLFIEQILSEGVRRGEFALAHPLSISADLVQCATLKFRFPHLWTTELLDALEIELERVLDLLFAGLKERQQPSPAQFAALRHKC